MHLQYVHRILVDNSCIILKVPNIKQGIDVKNEHICRFIFGFVPKYVSGRFLSCRINSGLIRVSLNLRSRRIYHPPYDHLWAFENEINFIALKPEARNTCRHPTGQYHIHTYNFRLRRKFWGESLSNQALLELLKTRVEYCNCSTDFPLLKSFKPTECEGGKGNIAALILKLP